jgi:anti-anti-sigma factor
VHLLSVAQSEDERRRTLGKWIVSALQEGEGFAYAEAAGASTSGLVSAALEDAGVDVEWAQRDGFLLRVPMVDFYAMNGPAMLVARARADGFQGVRIATDPQHGLQVLDQPAYLRYERRLADTCASKPLSALCQFDTAAAGSWFSEVSWMHMGYGPTSPFLAMPVDDSVFLFGEVDISNNDQMTEALRGAGSRADGRLKVDLTGLTLLTAAGCQALIQGTEDYRAGGGQVLLQGVRPSVQRVLKLLGFDQAPGFTIASDSA